MSCGGKGGEGTLRSLKILCWYPERKKISVGQCMAREVEEAVMMRPLLEAGLKFVLK